MLSDGVGSEFLWDCVWQSSVWLLIGIALSYVWRGSPARAHRVLMLAVVACLLSPFLSLAVRSHGLGVLPALAPASTLASAPVVSSAELAPVPAPAIRSQLARQSSPLTIGLSEFHSAAGAFYSHRIPLETIIIWGWGLLSGIVFLRLIFSFALGRRLISRAKPLEDDRIQRAADSAAHGLRIRTAPRVLVSDNVRCPFIWCWGFLPTVVLSAQVLHGDDSIDWEGILHHELGHWKRRDHLSALLAEIVVCVFPWQLLAWWARRRLSHLSERACDLWVLSCGLSGASFSQSLLRLLPQRSSVAALPAVSKGSNLRRRIQGILETVGADPRPGMRWDCAAVTAAGCLVSVMAFAQPQPEVSSARQASANNNTAPKEIRIDLPKLPADATPLEMVLIPAGKFTMGSPVDEPGRRAEWEWAPHEVTISKPFYMGKYEVTQAQWEAVTGVKPYSKHFVVGPNHPVAKPSWMLCRSFVKKLNRLGEGTFRLPTEAEWEYACRAGTNTRYFFGDSTEDADRYMWWSGNNDSGGAKEVGGKLPNPWGLHDTLGNVSEWCADMWEAPHARGSQTDPLPEPKFFSTPLTNRVFRGGHYSDDAGQSRAAVRFREQQIDFHSSLGLRVVRECP